jgi:AcrR family transcriptional regulator
MAGNLDDSTPKPWASNHVRTRIVEGAMKCLARGGLEQASISAIARTAGVARQSIYNHFSGREEILAEAIERAASQAGDRIMAVAEHNTTAAAYVVELCLAAVEEFHRNPVLSPLMYLLENPHRRSRALDAKAIASARRFLEPLVRYAPDRAPYLDEMTETMIRFQISVLTLDSVMTESPKRLRAYLHRALVPAMGLPPDDVRSHSNTSKRK